MNSNDLDKNLEMLKRAQDEVYEILSEEIAQAAIECVEDYYYGYKYLDFSDEVSNYIESKFQENEESSMMNDIFGPVVEPIIISKYQENEGPTIINDILDPIMISIGPVIRKAIEQLKE